MKQKMGVNAKLEVWTETLEAKGFRISRSKTKYIEFNFSKGARRNGIGVSIRDQEIPISENFKYLGLVLQSNGGIHRDVTHRLQARWTKWRMASEILCDRKIPLRLEGKFYRTAIRPAMLYGSKCWIVNHTHEQKMKVAEMRMLR
ncbi:hypothetical protein ACH5RR_023523 [Cinchona calisaya]|uniref:Reverse transcriptase n=1 Tax=Cinchona calisaya TaxID=153742 RepID=A0ABD2ZAX5_9GENT